MLRQAQQAFCASATQYRKKTLQKLTALYLRSWARVRKHALAKEWYNPRLILVVDFQLRQNRWNFIADTFQESFCKPTVSATKLSCSQQCFQSHFS